MADLFNEAFCYVKGYEKDVYVGVCTSGYDNYRVYPRLYSSGVGIS